MPNVPVGSLEKRHLATLSELEKYRLLVESVQDYAIFLLDPLGNVSTWNKGAQLNKGYTADEIIGKHFSVFYLQKDKDANKPARELELAIQFGRIEDEDWRVRKDGSKFWANVVITALYDPEGKLVGFAKVTRDLTERKQHEDRLRDANKLLKHQQVELEQLNSYKDEFISLASHQLRTPATSIKQYLGMILEGFAGEPNPMHLPFIQKAYASNERQLAIVSNLLRVAQVDAGQIVIHRVATDIEVLLHDVADAHKDHFRKRNQKVQIRAATTLPSVYVDDRYFRMVVENLVDNASKYTPENGTIKLAARQQGAHMLITIADTGVGIAGEDMQKLFVKFSRVQNELSDSVGGSGLGLYWVEKIIALHDGDIQVDSKVDVGTTFKITLPIGGDDA